MGDTISARSLRTLRKMLEQLSTIHPLLPPGMGLLALPAGAVTINLTVKQVLVRAVRVFAKRSSITWDDALVTHNVFGRLRAGCAGADRIRRCAVRPRSAGRRYAAHTQRRNSYMVLMLMLALTAMLSAANTIYAASPIAKERPLKGFVQIVVWILGGVLIVATVLDRCRNVRPQNSNLNSVAGLVLSEGSSCRSISLRIRYSSFGSYPQVILDEFSSAADSRHSNSSLSSCIS